MVDIVAELKEYNVEVDVYDPWVNPGEAMAEYGLRPVAEVRPGTYDAIVLAVAHSQFAAMGSAAIHALGKPRHVLYDLKYLFPADQTDLRL